uniref:Uncharacterized protein n=1 Tax=Panagrolaimus davidi TaxID=227884 RepID=A0A914PW36_9BILA
MTQQPDPSELDIEELIESKAWFELLCAEARLTKIEVTFPDVLRASRYILEGKEDHFDSFNGEAAKDDEGVRLVSKKLGLKINCMKEIRRWLAVSDEDFSEIYAKLKTKSLPWDKDFWKPFICRYEYSPVQVMELFRKYAENTPKAQSQWKQDLKCCYIEIVPFFKMYGMMFEDEQHILDKLAAHKPLDDFNIKEKLLQFTQDRRYIFDNARTKTKGDEVQMFDEIKKKFLAWLKKNSAKNEEAAPRKTSKKSGAHVIKNQKCVLCCEKLKGNAVKVTHANLVRTGRHEIAALVEHTIWSLTNEECDCFNSNPDKDSYLDENYVSKPFKVEKLPADGSDIITAELSAETVAELEAKLRADLTAKLEDEIRANLTAKFESEITTSIVKAVKKYKAEKKATKADKKRKREEESVKNTFDDVMATKLADGITDLETAAKRVRADEESDEEAVELAVKEERRCMHNEALSKLY